MMLGIGFFGMLYKYKLENGTLVLKIITQIRRLEKLTMH